MIIRHADPDRDAAACAAIYAPSVTQGVASLEERAPEPHEMADRIRITSRTHPWLVAELDDEVVGYAYGSRHHERAAYRWTADVTVYISGAHHRRGVGRALYAALFPLLERQGIYEVCAGVTLPNDASVGLHESLGFAADRRLPRRGLQVRTLVQRGLVADDACDRGPTARRPPRSARLSGCPAREGRPASAPPGRSSVNVEPSMRTRP